MTKLVLVTAIAGWMAAAAYGDAYPIEALPKAPRDPWAAVVGDQPRRMTAAQNDAWRVSADERECTAAIDHCFANDVWMIEHDERNLSKRYANAYGFVQYSNGYANDPGDVAGLAVPVHVKPSAASVSNAKLFTAYRTVPATKKNFVVGALVVALPFPRKHPASAMNVFEVGWRIGVIDRVDWDMGFVYLVGEKDPFWISAARVAVLSWRIGGKVTILGGAKRDHLAVSASDVILP